MKRAARQALALPLLLLLGAGCGETGTEHVSCDTTPEEGHHYEFVRSLERKSLAEKTGLVLERIRRLPLPESRAEATVLSLTRELVMHCEVRVLEIVERVLRAQDGEEAVASLEMVYLALSAEHKRPAVGKLLARLARELPDNLVLAPHRPGGEECLLQTLENENAPIDRRLQSVWRLGKFGGKASLERLATFQRDRTPDGLHSGSPFEADEDRGTLGMHVRRAIELVRHRLGE